jgi:secretion/DNA translocation related TadE-like protein
MVTAEFAMALPAVVLVLATVLATATVALNQMRCTDAAREAARAAARNEPAAAVLAVARAEGPPGVEVHVSRVGDRVVVTATAGVRVRLLGTETIRVSSRAVAVREPVGDLAVALLPTLTWRGRRRRRGPGDSGPPTGGCESGHRPDERGADRHAEPGPDRHAERCARQGRRPRRGGREHPRGPDAGAGTVLVLGLVAVGVLLALALSLLGQAVAARHRASTAADLAALAAAQVANAPPIRAGSGDPCDVARRTAADNGAVLTSCAVDDRGVATVTVRTDIKSVADVLRATARARAGPADIAERKEMLQEVIVVTH